MHIVPVKVVAQSAPVTRFVAFLTHATVALPRKFVLQTIGHAVFWAAWLQPADQPPFFVATVGSPAHTGVLKQPPLGAPKEPLPPPPHCVVGAPKEFAKHTPEQRLPACSSAQFPQVPLTRGGRVLVLHTLSHVVVGVDHTPLWQIDVTAAPTLGAYSATLLLLQTYVHTPLLGAGVQAGGLAFLTVGAAVEHPPIGAQPPLCELQELPWQVMFGEPSVLLPQVPTHTPPAGTVPTQKLLPADPQVPPARAGGVL